jgi:hypothetical protein
LLKPTVLFVDFQKGNEIHNQFLVMFSCYHFSEEDGRIILCQETAHHIVTFKECSGLSWKVCGFSALHILLFWLLMYPLRWNHALSQNKTLSKMSVLPQMKCVNHLQCWSNFFPYQVARVHAWHVAYMIWMMF